MLGLFPEENVSTDLDLAGGGGGVQPCLFLLLPRGGRSRRVPWHLLRLNRYIERGPGAKKTHGSNGYFADMEACYARCNCWTDFPDMGGQVARFGPSGQVVSVRWSGDRSGDWVVIGQVVRW